jgi:hypothetical protein
MSDTAQILDAMSPEQCLLAFVFIGSYAVAVGELAHSRWRRIAALIAFASAACWAALSDPWEQGVITVALAFVGMALFAAFVWGLWAVATWRERQAERALAVHDAVPAAQPAAAIAERPLLARLRASLRMI